VTLEAGINGVYNLFDKDGFHYCVFGETKVLKSTDDNQVRGPVRIFKSVDVAATLPPDAAKAVTRIIGINLTYDGYIAAAAPGALVVLDRDLNVKSYVAFPAEAVDNSIAIDEGNGIYVVTSRRMLGRLAGIDLAAQPLDIDLNQVGSGVELIFPNVLTELVRVNTRPGARIKHSNKENSLPVRTMPRLPLRAVCEATQGLGLVSGIAPVFLQSAIDL
jgi:hypothetical protein